MRALGKHFATGSLVLLLTIVGCAAPQATGQPRDVEGQRPSSPRRIVAAISGNEPSSIGDWLEEVTHTGLGNFDDRGVLHPDLAEAIPTVENGLWKVFADGRMETTWRIKPGAQWHDGAPLTTDDLLFSINLSRDRELPEFRHIATELIEAADGLDARTITLKWKSPYIAADVAFTRGRGGTPLAMPRPRHLLEKGYAENKAAFVELPYWSHDFVGLGAFKLREWVPGSHLVLAPHDRYVNGRPKLDEIEVRFFPDRNTLIASVLGGAVELTAWSNAVTVDDAVRLNEQWKDGKVDIRFSSWIVIRPQFLNPTPPLVTHLQFRRALLHAADRQQLADAFMGGVAPIAHGYLGIEDPAYNDLERSLVKYEYDPRKAAQMIEALGYAKGTDGVFQASNQRLSVGIRASPGAEEEKMAHAIADGWQRIGVGAEPEIVRAPRGDREFGATFRSFQVARHNHQLYRLAEFHTSEIPLPENRFSGKNDPRYSSPELDALIDRFVVTISERERNQIAGQIIRHMSDQLVMMGLVYNAETTMVSNRLQNVTGRTQATEAWNPHLWDVKW